MKITNRKYLVAGLLAGALTFVGCKSSSSAERSGGTTDTTQTPATGTGTGTTGTGTGTDTTGTGTSTNPGGTGGSGNCGTGGSGNSGGISTTKQSDDNLRMPEDDPLRLKDGDKNIRDAESEQGVHENSAVKPKPGTGGSGFNNDAADDNLNEGGNVDKRRTPGSPADVTPDGVTEDSSQVPEGTR